MLELMWPANVRYIPQVCFRKRLFKSETHIYHLRAGQYSHLKLPMAAAWFTSSHNMPSDDEDEQFVMDIGNSFRREQPAPMPECDIQGAMTTANRAAAMRKAIEASVKSAVDLGMEAPDEKTIAEAQAGAEKLLQESGPEGFADLRNLMVSTGLPAVRATFLHMMSAMKMKGSARTKAEVAIAAFSPITEKGCIQFDFLDRITGLPNTAYIHLDECPRDYDFGTALQGFQARLPPEKIKEVLDRSSMLFNSGRALYAQIAGINLPLIRKINRLPGSDPCTRFLSLQVDKASTTLYIDATWPNRVGLLIDYKADVDAAATPVVAAVT